MITITQVAVMRNCRPFVKEKREGMHEYIKKKRELFLANMNINTKKEETKSIKETLVNKEESLNAQQAVSKQGCACSLRRITELIRRQSSGG